MHPLDRDENALICNSFESDCKHRSDPCPDFMSPPPLELGGDLPEEVSFAHKSTCRELSTSPRCTGRYADQLRGTLLRMPLLAQSPPLSNSDVANPNSLSQKGTVLISRTTQLEHEQHGLSSVAMRQSRMHGREHQTPYHGAVGIGTTHQGCFV